MECQKKAHLIAPGYGNVAGVAGEAQSLFRKICNCTRYNNLGDVLVQAPLSFFMDGANDVLGYAVAGGIGKIKRQP
jgi:hypothetical protein